MTRGSVFQPKKRNSEERKRKRVVLFAFEGVNKTETYYFRNYNNDETAIKIANGGDTDPLGLMKKLQAEWKKYRLDTTQGDRAFCVVDADFNDKDKQMKSADILAAKSHIGQLIVSNPCFEIWFLCHFCLPNRGFSSNDEVIKELRKYLSLYEKKSEDVFTELEDKTDVAVSNAKKLEDRCSQAGYVIHTQQFTPSTEAYKVIEYLRA